MNISSCQFVIIEQKSRLLDSHKSCFAKLYKTISYNFDHPGNVRQKAISYLVINDSEVNFSCNKQEDSFFVENDNLSTKIKKLYGSFLIRY